MDANRQVSILIQYFSFFKSAVGVISTAGETVNSSSFSMAGFTGVAGGGGIFTEGDTYQRERINLLHILNKK